MSEPSKCYEVERIARTTTIVKVYARTAKEAKKLVGEGEGEMMGSETYGRGYGRVLRNDVEDR